MSKQAVILAMRFSAVAILLFLFRPTFATSTGSPQKEQSKEPAKDLSKESRLEFIRRAQVWLPTNISEMDLRAGPPGPDAVAPGETVTCDYVETKLSGATRKFDCTLANGNVVKVKYGTTNGEVEGEVLATRLLWALGFGADRLYPAKVVCRGCSEDPWTKRHKVSGEHLFDPAAIERSPAGHEIKDSKHPGWSWPELALIDQSRGGATLAQRDALVLLAVLMQHTDSKPEQQRLLCLPGASDTNGGCDRPFLLLHDVGMTFGHGNYFNRDTIGSVNFEEWAKTPVWRDPIACVAHLSRSRSGTLGDPKISEAGRQFLSNLLMQLSDKQLHDLFEVAQVDKRILESRNSRNTATIDDWVTAFKEKREEVFGNHCPS